MGIEGQAYYNSVSFAMRCYQNGAWKNCDVGQFDLQIGGNAYAGLVAVGTMLGYGHPVALRANGHNFITVAPDGGITVDVAADGGSFRGSTLGVEGWKFSRDAFAFNLTDAGSFSINYRGGREFMVSPDGGALVSQLRLGEPGSTDYVSVKAPPAMAASYDLTLPAAAGATGSVLSAQTGAGTLTWALPYGTCTLNGDGTNPRCTAQAAASAKCTCTIGGTTSLATIEACGAGDVQADGGVTFFGGTVSSTRVVHYNCGP